MWKREWYAEEEGEFVGKDGDGPEGRGGRAHEKKEEGGKSRWKENFPPSAATPSTSADGAAAAKTLEEEKLGGLGAAETVRAAEEAEEKGLAGVGWA